MTTRSLTSKRFLPACPAEQSTCEHLHQIHPQSEAHFPAYGAEPGVDRFLRASLGEPSSINSRLPL